MIPDHTITSPVRVCLTCYSHMRVVSSDSLHHILRKESFSSVASSLSICQWVLSLDEDQNAQTRNEFYYEAAPSSSLCLSILKLHTCISSCIHMILDQMIKSLFDVLTSNQVDYGLILNIIKTLLVSVRVIIETQQPGSIEMRPRREYVDLMLSRVDIVNMLVQQNCINKDLINSIILNESSNNQQSLQKLMEKLLEMERFELALNIGKKYGFDVKGIWKTWAVICLKNGKLMEARAKFRHVMEEPQTSSVNSKILQSIFDVFADDRTTIRLNQRTALKDRVDQIRKGKINALVAKDTVRVNTDTLLPKYLLDESLHYLKLYGCKEDCIKFYSRFGLWKSSLDVFLSEPSPGNLSTCFVQDFLLPAMKRSCFSRILTLIKSQDPTLSKSWKYLIAACKHFGKNNYFNVLHSLQVFMSDYIRAGISQVSHFFLEKPYNNYEELRKRLEHLTTARSHLQAFLENQSSHSSRSSYILIQTPAQVKKNIRTINHQIEITKTFAERGIAGFLPINFDSVHSELATADSPGSLTASLTASNIFSPTSSSKSNAGHASSPLTLFDESKARKTQLAALICVEMGNKIADGFALSHQLVQEYRLDAGLVYRLAGRMILVTRKAFVIDRLNQLLNCIRSADEPETLCDVVTGACIRACNHPELLEPMIKLLVSDVNKIDSYILCGKLRSAYLLAVRLERMTDVRRILAAAERTGQEIVKNWCVQWLQRNPST